MATKLTPNLRLRIADDLTADSRFNLNRLDLLGGTIQTDLTDDLNLRSRGDVILQPNSSDIGGSGSGGSIRLGAADQKISSFQVFADDLDLDGPLKVNEELRFLDDAEDNYVGFKAPSSLLSNQIWTLPDEDGSTGQLLSTDGSGNLSWSDPSGIDAEAFDWDQADGTTKTIVHSFGSTDVEVEVFDKTSNDSVTVDRIRRSDSNTVELTAIEAPPVAGYRVLIQEIV